MPFTPRTGASLLHDLATTSPDLPALIPDFLYAETATMLVAEPGIGKSIISMQVALSLSSGTALFGTLPIPEPKRVYYLQLEGAYHQSLDRIRLMQRAIPLVADNLCWDLGEGLNVMRQQDWLRAESRIKQFGKVDLLIFDPIYMLVSGGLSEDKTATAFVQFSNAMMQTFRTAIWQNHHSHRARFSKNGEEIQEDDPFYGSQWLKAHLDASWFMQRMARNKVRLDCKKDRHGVLTNRLDLIYHEDSMTCENVLYIDSSYMTKLLDLIQSCKKSNITLTFNQIADKIGVSHAHLRRLQNEIGKMNLVIFHKSPGKSTLWQPI